MTSDALQAAGWIDAFLEMMAVERAAARNTLTAYAKEQTRHKSLTDAVEANRQAVEIATQLYQSGLADFLRVLDSQRSLYESQDALVQSERAVVLNLIALYKALGGGWQTMPAQAAARS